LSRFNTVTAAPTIIAAMKIKELSDRALRRALRATEQAAGIDSFGAKVLRRELARRRTRRRSVARKGVSHDF
jgi:hypothetical protein